MLKSGLKVTWQEVKTIKAVQNISDEFLVDKYLAKGWFVLDVYEAEDGFHYVLTWDLDGDPVYPDGLTP